MAHYSKTEEALNIRTHFIGMILSIIGLILFLIKLPSRDNWIDVMSFIIFGISMVLLYLASTCYHSATDPKKRMRRKIFDHCAIYILIAGTYTPYALITLKGTLGLVVFSAAWSMAIMGVILKLFFTGRFEIFSTLTYVLMGWMVTFFITPLRAALHVDAFNLLALGGLSYTIGAIIYSIKKIKFNHAIFHVFVILGSLCHFLSIYLYV